ncbi:methionyl-tRNA formyltransferase [Erythrobacter sp. MTPC3]|uniref:methionyl-tRNA formyltransferase n=1 Tax=Erythrobacter sp. MTPC3 TaxID=3056564 RepID=UPI0036F25A03
MRIALVGAVESTLCAMRAMIDADCELALVATLTPDLAKRHSDFVDLAPIAKEHGVDLIGVRNINDDTAIDAFRKAAPDYIFVVGWSQICREEFMNIAPGKVIGYHPAPLPRMRGRAVLPWTIINDEKISGATMFWMDGGVDTGDILEQRFFHVAPRETARTLYDKHMAALDAMTRGAIAELSSDNPRREKQDEACATFAARRRPSDGRINWHRPAEEIDRLIRAVGRPYPGASCDYDDGQLTIWQARPLPNTVHHGTIGQIVAMTDDTFDIVTGDGLLRAEEWDVSGTKPVRMHAVLGGS